jgi:sigma-E factor negative regulatory protein RseB
MGYLRSIFIQPGLHLGKIFVSSATALIRFVLLLLTAFICTNAVADDSLDGMGWLKKMAAASQRLNYSGTFVYQSGNHSEVSRVSHYADASGEYEKLERLDGPPQQIIRTKDEVQCFYPQDKTIKIEKRGARKFFPFLFPEKLERLAEFYSIDKAEQDRISGFLSQALILKPRDTLRYGHKFWADVNSGLLLKAKRLSEKSDLLDQYTFTELVIGGKFDREAFNPPVDKQGWRRDLDGTSESNVISSEWIIANIPPGFQKIREMTRTLKGKPGRVSHVVYSDGLAALSIFIEPLTTSTQLQTSVTQEGPFSVYTKLQGEYLITVVGEVPSSTVTAIGDSISHKRKD